MLKNEKLEVEIKSLSCTAKITSSGYKDRYLLQGELDIWLKINGVDIDMQCRDMDELYDILVGLFREKDYKEIISYVRTIPFILYGTAIKRKDSGKIISWKTDEINQSSVDELINYYTNNHNLSEYGNMKMQEAIVKATEFDKFFTICGLIEVNINHAQQQLPVVPLTYDWESIYNGNNGNRASCPFCSDKEA